MSRNWLSNKRRSLAIDATKNSVDRLGNYSKSSEYLGLNPSHLWQAVNKNYVSKKLYKALSNKGLVPSLRKQTRLAASLRPDQRDKLLERVSKDPGGYTWTEFVRDLSCVDDNTFNKIVLLLLTGRYE